MFEKLNKIRINSIIERCVTNKFNLHTISTMHTEFVFA